MSEESFLLEKVKLYLVESFELFQIFTAIKLLTHQKMSDGTSKMRKTHNFFFKCVKTLKKPKKSALTH
jgi:hypothetical protein